MPATDLAGRVSRRGEGTRGQVLIIVALSMVVLIGFMALALDVGRAYAERRFLQNGTDAAALAVAGKLANTLQECTTASLGTACVNGVYFAQKRKDLYALALAAVYANESRIGYNAPQEADSCSGTGNHPRVQVYLFRSSTNSYQEITCDSSDWTWGDVYKVKVTAKAVWDTWFAPVVGQEDLGAAAYSVAQVSGACELPPPPGWVWPMTRRWEKVKPEECAPGSPCLFWDSNVVNQEDKAGATWKAVLNFGLRSTRNNNNSQQGYSTILAPRIQALKSALQPNDSQLWPRSLPDYSCTNAGGPYQCGTWDSWGNKQDIYYVVPDFPRDPQNVFFHGFPGQISAAREGANATRWWKAAGKEGANDCKLPGDSGGSGDCGIPSPSDFTSANGYAFSDSQWEGHPEGDWIETYYGNYGGGDVGNNIFAEIMYRIQNPLPGDNTNCDFSNPNSTPYYGRCITRVIYLWDGGQAWDPNGAVNNGWGPWNEQGNKPPDRVHIVEWRYFDFYEKLVASGGNSEVKGFWSSYGKQEPPPNPGNRPCLDTNRYFLINE